MKKLLTFAHYDYYLPLSAQAKQILSLSNAEEILKYPPAAIKKAKINVDKHDLTPANIKLSLMLNKPLKFPNDLNPLSIKELINHPDFHQNFKQYAQSRPANLTDGQKAELINKFNLDWTDKIQFSELDSFEEIWNILKWKSGDSFSNEEIKWIIRQTYMIIDANKLDLHYLSLIYEIICEKHENLGNLWEIYDTLCSDYFYAFSPDDILRVLSGYIIRNYKSMFDRTWISNLSNLNLSYFDDFSNLKLCRFIKLAEQLNMKLQIEVIDKARLESKGINYTNLYIWLKYKNKKLNKALLENILIGLSIDAKIDLIDTCLVLKLEDSFFSILINSLTQKNSEIPASEILKICVLFFSAKRFPNESINLLMGLESQIPTLPLTEVVSIIEFITKLKVSVSLSPKYIENLKNKVLESYNSINSLNFNVIVKFFSSFYPNQTVHDKLCQFLIDNNSADSTGIKRPDHQFFELVSPNKYLILNNNILNNTDFIRVLIIITCLHSTYPVPIELKKILKKYLKILINKCYFKLDLKFRSSIAEMLAKPESFDREIFLIFVEKVKLDLIHSNKSKTFLPFFKAIKELKAMGHSDKVLSQLFEIYP